MEKITHIFYNNPEIEIENRIKSISINWKQHSNGIVNIANSFIPKILTKDEAGKEIYKNGFILTEQTKQNLKLLLLYFSGNDLFCKELEKINGVEGSLNKGLFLIGGVGTGKTFLMKVFKEYTKHILKSNSFHAYNEQDIINLASSNGSEIIEELGYNCGNPKVLYIDDFGSKPSKIKYFGNSIDVIDNIMTLRYVIFNRYHKLTHISSNKYPVELQKIFDNRLIDRFSEMFNVIELNDESFRK